MKEKLEQKLLMDFPWLEAKNDFENEKLGYCVPCEFDDGWYEIIHSMCEEIEHLYKRNNTDISDIFFYEIKEKYGALNIYVGDVIDGTFEIIKKYETKSKEVCEMCGEKGKIRTKASWLKCLCDECKVKYGYNDCKK